MQQKATKGFRPFHLQHHLAGCTRAQRALVAPSTASGTAFQRDLPYVLKRLTADAPELAVANHLWLDRKLVKALSIPYVAAVSQAYQASGGWRPASGRCRTNVKSNLSLTTAVTPPR